MEEILFYKIRILRQSGHLAPMMDIACTCKVTAISFYELRLVVQAGRARRTTTEELDLFWTMAAKSQLFLRSMEQQSGLMAYHEENTLGLQARTSLILFVVLFTTQWVKNQLHHSNAMAKAIPYPFSVASALQWYPETWTVGGQIAHFQPSIGYYSSSDPFVVESHLDSLDYAHVDVSIASWWGIETNLDRARLLLRMDKTIETGSNLKWTIYYGAFL
jgi:PIN domain nuclease of toxin-antitoxin system